MNCPHCGQWIDLEAEAAEAVVRVAEARPVCTCRDNFANPEPMDCPIHSVPAMDTRTPCIATGPSDHFYFRAEARRPAEPPALVIKSATCAIGECARCPVNFGSWICGCGCHQGIRSAPLPAVDAGAVPLTATTKEKTDDHTRVEQGVTMPKTGSTASDILESFDARDWARTFCDIYEQRHGSRPDEDWLVTWFANALMRGWDEHARRYPTDALIHQVGLFDSTPLVSQPHFDACNAIFIEALALGRPHVDHDAPEYRHKVPLSVGAVDPHAADPGNPSTREKESSDV